MSVEASRLDAIQAQWQAAMARDSMDPILSERWKLMATETPYLLALARKQQAAIERMEALAEQWQENFPYKADRIRAALEATP